MLRVASRIASPHVPHRCAVSVASRAGITVKSRRALEALGSVTALIVDKTGTLTRGTPSVVRAALEPEDEAADVLAADRTARPALPTERCPHIPACRAGLKVPRSPRSSQVLALVHALELRSRHIIADAIGRASTASHTRAPLFLVHTRSLATLCFELAARTARVCAQATRARCCPPRSSGTPRARPRSSRARACAAR